MKIRIILHVLLLFIASSLCATEDVIRPSTSDLPNSSISSANIGNELAILDNIMEITKQNFETQKQLRGLIVEYLQVKHIYLQNIQDKELSFKMVQKAYQVLEKIKEAHLIQAFDKDFMSEITFFANIASKWNNPQ